MTVIAASSRWKTYRQRLKAGRIMVAVEVDEVETCARLQQKGWLTVSDPSREDISEALRRWIERELQCDH